MRYIPPSQPPQSYIQWRKANRDNPSYADIPEKKEIRASLLAAQGYLCAYTMRSLTLENSHIEHFYPQSGPDRSKAIDYSNFLACYPGNGANASYGALAKADSLEKICDPHKKDEVTDCFEFLLDGTIKGKTDLAKTTIRVLNLNDESLKIDRRSFVDGYTEAARRGKLSASRAESMIHELNTPDAQGQLQSYCVARQQFLQKFVISARNRSSRLKRTHG